MRQFQVQVCYLFDRSYTEDELFEEPLDVSDDTTGIGLGINEPLIGFYTTRLVTAKSLAEAVNYVEENLEEDEDLPEGRIFDLSCSELKVSDLDPEVMEDADNPDVPGIWYEDGFGFFSQMEAEHPHHH